MLLQVGDWKRLGLALKLNSFNLNIIEKDNRGDTRQQTLEMFELWLKTQPDASYEQLIKALHEVGAETVASSLSIKYGKYITVDYTELSSSQLGKHFHTYCIEANQCMKRFVIYVLEAVNKMHCVQAT